MDKILGDQVIYYSLDHICKSSSSIPNDKLLYSTEFLYSLTFFRVPNHSIFLKIGTPMMLLRNLNQVPDLYNGTRLIITYLGKWHVQARKIACTNKEDNVLILQIIMTPNNSRRPFKPKHSNFLWPFTSQ